MENDEEERSRRNLIVAEYPSCLERLRLREQHLGHSCAGGQDEAVPRKRGSHLSTSHVNVGTFGGCLW